MSPQRLDYAAPRGRGSSIREVERRQHSAVLLGQLKDIVDEVTEMRNERVTNNLSGTVDLILQVETQPGFCLSADESYALTRASRIELLHLRQFFTASGLPFTRVVLHVPYGELAALLKKVRAFGEEATAEGNTPFPWVANLATFARAAFEALWTDGGQMPEPDALGWWQLWVRRYPVQNEVSFRVRVAGAHLTCSPEIVKLPEHSVYTVQTTRAILESSFDLLNTLAEIRLARRPHQELSHLPIDEVQDWIDLALEKIEIPSREFPAVCVLDTGIHRGHRLLSVVLAPDDNLSVFEDGDASDSYPGFGHGTLMAGLSAYGDLRNVFFAEEGAVLRPHSLEGVKIFDPLSENEVPVYGPVTLRGMLKAENAAPLRERVFALAVTAQSFDFGRPSAWSSSIDLAAFQAWELNCRRRLIVVSAGNLYPETLGGDYRYPPTNNETPLEEPAQAWNALTVGAITHFTEIRENDPESKAIDVFAQDGALSPYSMTSVSWDQHWPIKPEIVMEGGNCGRGVRPDVEGRDSLEPLTTSKSLFGRPICAFSGTSAAAALAARLAATIQRTYPGLWPETVRGLLVHSARWSPVMLDGIEPHRAHGAAQRKRFMNMLRTYGFGEPNPARCRYSSQQEVTMFREDSLIPYRGNAGSASANDCHIHELQLPSDLLAELLDVTCTMRVTLSYFIEPNPSTSNRMPGSRYRYANCLLRFRVQHPEESSQAFRDGVAREANDDDGEDDQGDALDFSSWALGPKIRGKGGSVVHDVWRGSAAELARMALIAVYPVKGWWASRSFPVGSPSMGCHLRPVRYSLVVSLEVEADIQLYAEISNLIAVVVDA